MKTETQVTHTPGPWFANRDAATDANEYVVQSIVRRANGGMIDARCVGPNAEANARLIAAAPELLEALKAMVAEVECFCADYVANNGPCPVHQAKAAIAKAEGR